MRKIEVVANVASGSVGPDAPEVVAKILADAGLEANISAPAPEDITKVLQAAVDAKPDLLIILAGDGTARAAAQLCGPDGPLLAPLPGGTMNMLPHAIYGVKPWPEALTLALQQGEERMIGGGVIDGHNFMVAAIMGAPALWAPAREAARYGKPRLAWLRARRAMRRAFSGRVRYSLDGSEQRKAEALVFMCPLTSKNLDSSEAALEAAAFDVHGAADAVKLGLHALTGEWRESPNVEVTRCQLAFAWAKNSIPAILDGESVRLTSLAEIRYEPRMARMLALDVDA